MVNKRRTYILLKILGISTVCSAVLFIVLDICCPFKPNIEYGQLVLARDSSVLHIYLTKDEQWRMKTRLDEITPELKKAILYKEDKYFRWHPGINPIAITRAVFNNVIKRKRTSGASTITMQVARMLSPKKRTYVNKAIEMFRALQLEVHHTKDEILQMYLNLVPYGSNIQGVKAASILYFNKMPDQLSLAEITALSIIPNRPNSLTIGRHNKHIVQERNKWLNRFQANNLFSKTAIKDALNEPLTAYRHSAPKRVPQLAYRLSNQRSTNPEIITTIDASIQQKAEDIVSAYSSNLQLNNIHNAAAIIINNNTNEVVAYIGSPDFSDNEHNGQVDGIMAARSPGSTLKPILYSVCIDRGLISPKSIITDVPINYDGYAPENYDLEFRGKISIEDALRYSLNIPAVKLLDKVGVAQFINTLAYNGVSTVWDDKDKLGLSMILGGCTIRLDELSAIYSSYANEGKYANIKYTSTDTITNSDRRVCSPEAAYMITNILKELHRPDLPNLSDNAVGIPKIAWKTGTSYGRKDAWSIGYNKEYTIGVWVGNFDGTGVPELNGAGSATPLLFKLFNSIASNTSEEWLDTPDGLQTRYVCKQSGLLPNSYCTEQVADLYIPGITNYTQCNHLKEVKLSAEEDFSYCTACLPANGYKIKQYPNIEGDLAAYYDLSNISYDKVPPHNPKCGRMFDGSAPTITSLTDKSTYIIVDKEQQKLQLKCTASNDVKKVYWYINDKYYTTTNVGEDAFFIPETSTIKISCADDKGRNVDINIKIQFI